MQTTYVHLLLLIMMTSAIDVGLFSREMLAQIRNSHDYVHHFVFFDLNILTQTRPYLDQWNIVDDIKFYYNQCQVHKLPECQSSQQFPILLVFNKVLIRFNGNPKDPKEISQWMQNKVSLSPKYITNLEQLQAHLVDNHNVFCICHTQNSKDDTSYFYTLSKTFSFAEFCVITNPEVYKGLGLQDRNVTMFIDSINNRKQYQHQNRYENWQIFVKINVFSSIGRADQLASKRFAQQNKHLKAVVLVCDYSYQCQNLWKQVSLYQSQLNQQKLGYQIKLSFLDQKQSYVFNLYYNFIYNTTDFPALVYIDVLSTEGKAGKLKRYMQYPQSQFNMEVLHNFVKKVQSDQIQQFHLSAKTPKNNGFYGKFSQKMVQKLTANTVVYEIQYSQKNYILLVTALYIGCQKCDQFYKQYKQIASLLIDKDITFGLLNVYQNEVQIQQVTTLPEILLYKKNNKLNPIRLQINHSFEHLINFIKDHLGKQFFDDQAL